jgi:predicted transcriptional regulator
MGLPELKPGETWADKVEQELGLDKPGPKTTMTAIRLPDELRSKLEYLAAIRGVSRSELMRQVLNDAVGGDNRARIALENLAAHREMRLTEEARWARSLRAAHEAGNPIRKVAEVAGLSTDDAIELMAKYR